MMPDYETLRREIKTKTQNSLDFRRDFSDEEVKEVIDRIFLETREISLLSVKERRQLNKEVFDSLRRLDILQEFVDDPSVTEPCTLMKIPAKPRRNRAFQRLSDF